VHFPQPTQSFLSSQGRIAFDVEGEGPNVVLVHGTPTSSVIWRGVVDRLKRRYCFHYFDLPGYGASDMHEGQEVRLRSFARVLREFIEHVGLGSPHIVGHDFGGGTVLGAHLVEGVEAASLTIADGVVLNPWGTPYSLLVQRYEAVFSALPPYVHRAVLTAHLLAAMSRKPSPELLAALVDPWTGEVGQAAYYPQVSQYDHDFTARLEPLYPAVRVPTLVLWGEEDHWIDTAVGRRISGLIPGARFTALPDAGHFSMLDSPGLFSQHLGDWLDAVERAGKGAFPEPAAMRPCA
jgi:pimeloyl-ACP methyl ester carboxylesterase